VEPKKTRNRVRKIFVAEVNGETYYIESESRVKALRFAIEQQGLIKVRPATTADMTTITNAVANGAEVRKL